jgi:hypothetical protein
VISCRRTRDRRGGPDVESGRFIARFHRRRIYSNGLYVGFRKPFTENTLPRPGSGIRIPLCRRRSGIAAYRPRRMIRHRMPPGSDRLPRKSGKNNRIQSTHDSREDQ